MKKITLAVVLIISTISIIYISGCESSSSDGGTAVLKGTVRDSATNTPLSGVLITTNPASSNATTDSVGNFMITGLEAGQYTLTAVRSGWYTRTLTVEVVSDDTTTANFKMYFTNIYTFNNLTVNEYFNDNSFSAVNLYLGKVIQEADGLNKDMQLRDSSGTSHNFFFRSGDLALLSPGWETKFSYSLVNPRTAQLTHTQTEFDTLSKYYGASNPINPNLDFQNNRTEYFDDNPNFGTKRVYAFWLKGRNYVPPTYGLFYIDSVYRSGSEFRVVIDLKINRNGLNLFNPNQ